MSMDVSNDLVAVEQTRRIMATRMAIHVAVPPSEVSRANATLARAMAWLESLSDRLTRFSEESELALLNRSAGEWCAVSGVLFSVVTEGIAAACASDGLFDPTLLPLLKAIGYDRDYDEIEHRESGGAGELTAFVVGQWREIELDAQRLRIRLPPDVQLDLGGIAKGWAADALLSRHLAGYANVLVDAGGDMRAHGGPTLDEPWPIAIGSPFAPTDGDAASAAVLTLGRGGIATSGATGRWWLQQGLRQHHLLDPRTARPIAHLWIDGHDDDREPASLIATATALAPTAAHAEVAAKVALLRGYPEALRYVESGWATRHDADAPPYGDAPVALLLILGDGRVVCSANIHEYLPDVGGGGDLWMD